MSKLKVYSLSDRDIILMEILIAVVVLSAALYFTTKIHIAICIGISLVLGSLIFGIFRTKVGFWIVSIFFSIMWSIFAAGLAYGISKEDIIWAIFAAILAFLMSIGGHLLAKDFYDDVDY